VALPAPAKGSIALITGASAGLGAEFARQLGARGHRVALVARRAERLHALCKELGGSERALAIAADLTLPEDRDRVVAELDGMGMAVEILVNNAGSGSYRDFIETPRERELQTIRLDVEAVVDFMARFLPGMVERARGAVINMSSTSGFLPGPHQAGYAAAKAHVLILSESVNEELRGTGVSVTAVCPGPVPTEFQDANSATFARKLPKLAWVAPDRVVSEALAAAAAGRRSVVPGGPHVKASFVPTRYTPPAVTLPVTRWLLKP
jgi:short-subunit dehydrogenase